MKQRQIDEGKYQQVAWDFFQKQQKMKQLQKKLDVVKQEFEDAMEELFGKMGGKSISFGGSINGNEVLKVNRIEKTSIVWDAEKLSKRLPKSIARKCIRKKYHIQNMPGLVEYLKSCGVDPKEFKKYLSVEMTVDQDEVDRLGDIGQISVKNISGCYIVKCQKPYFTTSVKKDDGDGEE